MLLEFHFIPWIVYCHLFTSSLIIMLALNLKAQPFMDEKIVAEVSISVSSMSIRICDLFKSMDSKQLVIHCCKSISSSVKQNNLSLCRPLCCFGEAIGIHFPLFLRFVWRFVSFFWGFSKFGFNPGLLFVLCRSEDHC